MDDPSGIHIRHDKVDDYIHQLLRELSNLKESHKSLAREYNRLCSKYSELQWEYQELKEKVHE